MITLQLSVCVERGNMAREHLAYHLSNAFCFFVSFFPSGIKAWQQGMLLGMRQRATAKGLLGLCLLAHGLQSLS